MRGIFKDGKIKEGEDPFSEEFRKANAGDLIQFVIYDHPRDYPDSFVARRWFIKPGEVIADNRFLLLSPNIDTIREFMLQMGLACITRSPEDDPVILETWL